MFRRITKFFLLSGLIFVLQCGASTGGFIQLEKQASQNDEKAINELINILATNEDPEMRAKAARSIGNVRVKQANSQLLKSLETDDDTVRKDIIISLGKVGIPSNLGAVIAVWKNTNEKKDMRLIALHGIGYFSSDKAVKLIIGKLDSQDYKTKNAAIRALANAKSSLAASALVDVLKTDMKNTLAAGSLAKLKRKSSYGNIISVLDEKVGQYQFDEAFIILAQMFGEEKYLKSKVVLAKAYLISHESKKVFRRVVLKSLKDIKVDTSYCIIAVNSLNLRKSPNTRAKVVGKLKKREFATVIEVAKLKHKIDNISDYWHKVKSEKGEKGWIFGAYIEKLNHTKMPENP